MTYDEARKSMISKKLVAEELERHNMSMDEFVKEKGDRSHYHGRIVLQWMGY